MNDRSLRRKLRQQGLSYRGLLDELRTQIAVKYLRTTRLSNDDIALALGFSDAPPTFVVRSIDGPTRRQATSEQNRPPSGVSGRLLLGQPSNRLNQGRPVRGRSHSITTSRGVRRLRGRLCRWTTASAKASACSPDCRFCRASDIHSRMMSRRTFGLAIVISFR
jgi:hypothetical protein